MTTLSWQQLALFIEQHDLQGRPLAVALSGGVDSICLLHQIKELKEKTGARVSAVHVNHGLSQNAGAWQRSVEAICATWDIDFVAKRVHIEHKSRTSLEQQAREARYEAIALSLAEGSVLLTGHHRADQFETFMLRLMRGSGLTGLAAMKAVASLPNELARSKQLTIARPLLTIDKQQIVDYAREHKLQWVEDESNCDQRFDRNFIRKSLLPLFQQRWPGVTKAVETSTTLLEQEALLLKEYLAADLGLLTERGFANLTCMNLSKLKELSRNKQSSLVRLFISEQVNTYPSRKAMDELLNKLIYSRRDGQAELKLTDKISINVYNEQLYVVKTHIGCQSEFELFGGVSHELNNALYTELIIQSPTDQCFTVKFGQLSDKLVTNKNSGSKKVKALLKEAKCPPWLRADIPLIYRNNKLVAVADIALDVAQQGTVKVTLKPLPN